jgi:cytochrome c oxidase subunit 2
MSSSPGSRSTQTAVFALAVGTAIVGLSLILVYLFHIDVLAAGQQFITGLYPPIAVTSEGAQIRDLYTVIFLIAVAIFIVVEGLIIWTVIRYRRKPTDVDLPPQTHGNNVAEFVWTIVPTILVLFMFVISWQTLNEVDTSDPSAQTKIRAVAGQFQWVFEYLDKDGTKVLYTEYAPRVDGTDATIGGMYVPAGRTVQLQLFVSPKDVIHAFYVPQFLFKRDVVPGRLTAFDFTVNESDAGQTFHGQCAELCGVGHSTMLFDVKAVTAAQFDTWLADKVAKANATPAPAPSGSGPAVKISAVGVKFEQTAISAPAAAPWQIDFENKDPAIPHNVAIHEGTPTGKEVFKGEIFPGVATKVYSVPALPAGGYAFVCTVHPTMTGTLTVQ